MSKALYTTEELLIIKWHLLLFIGCTIVAIAIYLGVQAMESESSREVRNAQSGFEQARSSVELIEEEEATIIEYIDEFQLLSSEGIFEPEDRLQFLEDMAVIRDQLNLFPIKLSINEQYTGRLEYSTTNSRSTGGPIDLNSSEISLSMPLLHEEDFTRFLDAIENSGGLFQIKECGLTLRNTGAKTFITLQQHMSVDCLAVWYTYNLNPIVEQPNGGLLGSNNGFL